jgi:hypothetical protein
VVDGIRTTGDESFWDVVIVNASPISRLYYSGEYERDVQKAPTCWSLDTQRPDPKVPEKNKQSDRCIDCSQNIRGSSTKFGRACRFVQFLAVVFENKLDMVYRLKLPATSIYGRGEGGHTPLQEFNKFLTNRGALVKNLVTRIYFDRQSHIPKLYFKAIRVLGNEEMSVIEEVINSEDVKDAIGITPKLVNGHTQPFSIRDGFKLNATKGN